MITLSLPDVGSAVTAGATADPKLVTAAKQFETVLLSQWLQGAESSFASVPGGNDDTDAGGEQMHSFATQQLATSLTASGGVGIAKLVLGALTKVSAKEHDGADKAAVTAAANGSAAITGALAAYRAE